MARAPVEVLFGSAAGAVRGIEDDFALLERSDEGAGVRVWSCEDPAVVLGVSRDVAAEVNASECERRGIAVLRRASGGGTVVIGPGTLQYAFAFRHRPGIEPPTIDGIKQTCNDLVIAALRSAGAAPAIESDCSGDLRADSRKVGGLALRRRRDATLLHGTLLVDADLDAIGAVLSHPLREPAWRQGRPHVEFLLNLGSFDTNVFLHELRDATARFR